MLFNHTAQKKPKSCASPSQSSSCSITLSYLWILVEFLNSPQWQRILCGCSRKASIQASCSSFSFSFRDTLPISGLGRRCRCDGEEGCERRTGGQARPTNFSNANWKAVLSTTGNEKIQPSTRFARGEVVGKSKRRFTTRWSRDEYRMALAFWQCPTPSVLTSQHSCALCFLPSWTCPRSGQYVPVLFKDHTNEIVASLRCALDKSSPESSTFHSASKGSQRGQV